MIGIVVGTSVVAFILGAAIVYFCVIRHRIKQSP